MPESAWILKDERRGTISTLTTKASRRADKMFACFFFVLAIALAMYTASRTYDKLSAASWPAAQAEVLSSSMTDRSVKRRTLWCLALHYRYLVQGQEYSSRQVGTSRVREAGCNLDRSVVADMVAQLPPGAQVEIRYNPSRPGMAVMYVEELDLLDFSLPLLVALLGLIGLKVARPPATPPVESEAKSQLFT